MFGKFWFAALGAVLVVVATTLSDNRIEVDEAIAIGVAAVNAATVYVVPNLDSGIGKYAKAICSGLLAVLTGLAGWMVGGMSGADWINLVLAFATAAGVLVASAPQHPTARRTPVEV